MNDNNPIDYFDVLDENGKRTDKVKTKEKIIKDRDFYRIVNPWIINPNSNQILIQKQKVNP